MIVAKTIKRFLEWIGLKERLHGAIHKPPLFKECEVWWCSFGENIGIEVNGKGAKFSRPAIIFKKLSADGFFAIPLSTQIKNGTWYVPITHREIKCVAVLSQARVLSAKRLLEKYGELDAKDVQTIKDGFFLLYLGKKFVPLFRAGSWDNPK
jgi:mRNA interferase MazF